MITGLFFLWLFLYRQEQPVVPQAGAQQSFSQKSADVKDAQVPNSDLTNFENLLNPHLTNQSTAPPNHQSLFTNHQDSTFFKKIAAQLAFFNTQYAPEKVYLQFDRTFFEPGNSIWFNAFVRDANSLKASTKSELLHVELLAPNGSVLKKITLLAKGGTAAGDFQLDATAPGGMYKIKAWTNWQLNLGESFQRDIQVQASVLPRLRMELDFQRKAYGAGDAVEAKLDLNTLANQPLANHSFSATASLNGQQFTTVSGTTDGGGRAMVKFNLPASLTSNDGLLNVLIEHGGQTESISRSIPIVLNKIDLQFLPEGGDMVAGLPATVAFKALNEFGKPADVEGEILNTNGLVVSTFRSYHQGMGAFQLTPDPNENYTVRLTKPEGISEKYTLPEMLPAGYSLSVDPTKTGMLEVEVSSTQEEPLNIAVVSRGEILFTKTLPAIIGTQLVKIPTEKMPIGVAQVALFDSHEIPRAERLVFLNAHKQLKVNILTDKEKYLPREKVTMTVSVTDERGVPMPGQFSLAVVDDNLLTFADDKQGHILANLLIESELQGKVEEPNFYFEAKEKHPGKDEKLALDYLMMTQGWRRLAWEELLREQPIAALDFEGEKATTRGKVVDAAGKPVVGMEVGYDNSDIKSITDNQGSFCFDYALKAEKLRVFQNGQPYYYNDISRMGNYGDVTIKLNYTLQNYKDLKASEKNIKAIAKANKSTAVIEGLAIDKESGAPIIFGTVAVYKNGKIITGTDTDIDGYYSIANLPPGTYDLEFSYTGYYAQRISGVPLMAGKATKVDGKLASGVMLDVVAVSYKRPLVETEATSQGEVFNAVDAIKENDFVIKDEMQAVGIAPLTSDEIRKIPTRSVNALASLSAGVATADDGAQLNFRGSRADGTNYYLDGIRITGREIPKSEIEFNTFPMTGTPAQFGETVQVDDQVVFLDQSSEEKAESGRIGNAPPPPLPPKPKAEEEEIFKLVEDSPIFPGCENILDKAEQKKCSDERMKQFVYGNVKYPAIAKESAVQGTTIVRFVVEKDGSITQPEVIRDIGAGCGEEALRVVKMMPKWKPGTQRGRPVRAQYNLPVKFMLDGSMAFGNAAPVVIDQNIYAPRQFYTPIYEAKDRQSEDFRRTDFRKTIFWQPSLNVGRNGKATVEFYASDDITTFRATVEGIATDGMVGRGEQRFFTQKPVGMSVKMPVNLLTGDRLLLPLTLTNNTDREVTGNLIVTAPDGFASKRELPQTLTLKAHETKTIYPEYEVGQRATGGTLQVAFMAEGLQDAIAQQLKVQPRGFPVAQVFGGNKLEDSFEFEVKDMVEGSLQAGFAVHPSVLSDLTSGLEKMLKQPYGCFEQTSSCNYPNVLVLNFLKTTGNAAPEIEKLANQHLDFGYKRLMTFEVKGGGFDWHGSPPATEALTAYGLMEFVDMKSVYPVEQDLIDRTVKWLLGRRDGQGSWLAVSRGGGGWRQQTSISDAYITWALTEAGYGQEIPKEIEKTIADAKQTQDPYIMALAANILLNINDLRSNELLSELSKLQGKDGSWTGKTQSMTCSTGKNLTVETTGLATMAFLKSPNSVFDENGTFSSEMVARKAVDFLATAKTPYGFGSTQATILALKALMKHAEIFKKSQTGGTVALFVNGQKAGEQTIAADQKEALHFDNLTQLIIAGKNKVEVKFSGTETAPPYDLNISYSTRQPNSDPNCKLALSTSIINHQSSIKAGETVRLTTVLTNATDAAVPNPIALVGIPAGLSVQPWQVKEMGEKGLFDFYEITEGYVVFYFRSMEGREVKNIHLDLKADLPGEYEAPASSAYLYYSNDAVVWSKPEKLRIEN